MKKLLSILLAVAMVASLVIAALPVIATETTYDVQITSDIRIDEVYRTTGDHVYMWTEYGKFDAIVAGKELKNITLGDLRWAIYETYQVDLYESTDDGDQVNNPWTVGNKYPITIAFKQWSEETQSDVTVLNLSANVLVHETEIASISVNPITRYYGAENYKEIIILTTYKDGTVEKQRGGYMRDWEWPTEIGTYEEKIYLHWGYEIPVTINVVAVPTSGKCGDNLNWTYDAATKKLTISGTGAMYEIAKDLDTFWEYDYSYEPEFWYCDVQDIVVEEGVTSLPNFAFGWLEQKTLQLPSTLKEIPQMWLTVSMEQESLAIPEGVTSLTGWPFGSPGNSFGCFKELHLPASMTKIDQLVLLFAGIDLENSGDTFKSSIKTIYYGGSPAQWDAIEWVKTDYKPIYGDDYDGFLNDFYTCAEEAIKGMNIIFAKSDIPVTDGVATIPDESVKVTEGEDVVIDVTNTTEKAESVIIATETVDKIADAETAVQIKLPDATVSFDKTAIDSIGTQAGTSSVTIVAKEVEKTTLNTQQKTALENKEVCAVLNLEAFAGQTKITQFGGGKVTVSVPFDLPTGKAGTDYYVAYVADDGTITAMPTTYADGVLKFETTHFSSFVVLENVKDSDPTGIDLHIAFFGILMIASAAYVTACVSKRKAF